MLEYSLDSLFCVEDIGLKHRRPCAQRAANVFVESPRRDVFGSPVHWAYLETEIWVGVIVGVLYVFVSDVYAPAVGVDGRAAATFLADLAEVVALGHIHALLGQGEHDVLGVFDGFPGFVALGWDLDEAVEVFPWLVRSAGGFHEASFRIVVIADS